MPTDDSPIEASQFEKLGSFYLGREVDREDTGSEGPLLMYEARDLTTHAVAVGMTGSGKTGLCLSLLEEAAIDGIPAIAIDPKGDLGNLLLTFPDLAAADFRPWIDEGKAARKGVTPEDLAEQEASKWKKGLASWGQDGDRIARLRESVDLAVYTPGASHGLPLAVLRSLSAPPAGLDTDPDASRERVASTVSALLALAGEEVDPLQSREHILLSHIVEAAWDDGIDLDLEAVIRAVQSPGFDRVGVLDLDSFYPQKDRFALAMKLNNLLAAPGFEAWLEGEPLDIRSLLWTKDGKPRISIISIAHLGDAERMFLVTLVLNELLAWVRTRPGTSSLRAILYMDEVMGYLPPSRIPPSKPPLLTLLKQARAYGLGVVLATQNPVDLDYKALSNAGTWFLGRLQTERDKNRVMDGLDGAAAFNESGLDRREMDRLLGGLESRMFLLNNVHEDGPVLFRTRWAMSYLRGPMARLEIRRLMEPRRSVVSDPVDRGASGRPERSTEPPAPEGAGASAAPDVVRPVVPPGVEEAFVRRRTAGAEGPYRPALLAEVDLHYARAALKLDHWKRAVYVSLLPSDVPPNPWDTAVAYPALELSADPEAGIPFGELPGAAARPGSYRSWKSALKSHLYQNQPLELRRCAPLKVVSEAGESEGDFRVRVREAARDARDLELDKLRDRYATKLARIDAKIRKAEEKVDREESQYSQQKMQTAISVGASVLDAFLGRKKLSRTSMGRATTAMRGAGRASRERDDIRRAEESLETLLQQKTEMEEEFASETTTLRDRFEPDGLEIETVTVAPRKADIAVQRLVLAWLPGPVDA
ncbi:MAG: ATP-binding protein [Gemmatimonadetes bacterium]|nr:ATP-binding protein [Gemmatimonadota bacterium]